MWLGPGPQAASTAQLPPGLCPPTTPTCAGPAARLPLPPSVGASVQATGSPRWTHCASRVPRPKLTPSPLCGSRLRSLGEPSHPRPTTEEARAGRRGALSGAGGILGGPRGSWGWGSTGLGWEGRPCRYPASSPHSVPATPRSSLCRRGPHPPPHGGRGAGPVQGRRGWGSVCRPGSLPGPHRDLELLLGFRAGNPTAPEGWGASTGWPGLGAPICGPCWVLGAVCCVPGQASGGGGGPGEVGLAGSRAPHPRRKAGVRWSGVGWGPDADPPRRNSSRPPGGSGGLHADGGWPVRAGAGAGGRHTPLPGSLLPPFLWAPRTPSRRPAALLTVLIRL